MSTPSPDEISSSRSPSSSSSSKGTTMLRGITPEAVNPLSGSEELFCIAFLAVIPLSNTGSAGKPGKV